MIVSLQPRNVGDIALVEHHLCNRRSWCKVLYGKTSIQVETGLNENFSQLVVPSNAIEAYLGDYVTRTCVYAAEDI